MKVFVCGGRNFRCPASLSCARSPQAWHDTLKRAIQAEPPKPNEGQMVAVEQASIAKKCNIQFEGQRPRGLNTALAPLNSGPLGCEAHTPPRAPIGGIMGRAKGSNAPAFSFLHR